MQYLIHFQPETTQKPNYGLLYPVLLLRKVSVWGQSLAAWSLIDLLFQSQCKGANHRALQRQCNPLDYLFSHPSHVFFLSVLTLLSGWVLQLLCLPTYRWCAKRGYRGQKLCPFQRKINVISQLGLLHTGTPLKVIKIKWMCTCGGAGLSITKAFPDERCLSNAVLTQTAVLHLMQSLF